MVCAIGLRWTPEPHALSKRAQASACWRSAFPGIAESRSPLRWHTAGSIHSRLYQRNSQWLRAHSRTRDEVFQNAYFSCTKMKMKFQIVRKWKWNTCSSRTNISASTSKNRRHKSFVFYHSEVSNASLCVCYRFVFCLSEIISVILWFCMNMKFIAHNRTDLDEPYWTALNQTGPNRSLRGNPTIKTAYSSEFSKTSCWAIEYSVK